METLYCLEVSDRRVSIIERNDEKTNELEHLLRVELLVSDVWQIVREEIIEYMEIESIVRHFIDGIK